MTIHEAHVLDKTGHTEIKWNPANQTEVDIAEAAFDHLIDEGYRAFRLEGGGAQGSRMDTFDPSARAVMMLPQLKGG